MTNFDFHKLLFPTEFENFCRDVLEIREKNIRFTTYKSGRDGGIDIKSTNTKEKIIGQCKLYDPNNYNGLLRSLKKEVIKCKKQNTDRYILCINIELTPARSLEIKEIFGDYIQYEEDIIDGIKLNKYLNQEEYEYLFKSYSKLLVPNFKSIEFALDKVVYRKYHQKTIYFLNQIKSKHRLFHHTAQLPFLIQKLEENKVIILTGNPGVGKTTTAMMIANYFLSRKVKDLIFLEERDYTDVLSIIDGDRLVVVDDFWGQNFTPDIKNHSTFQREFQTIIEHVINSDNCFLILTSRDYVIRDVLKRAEFETKNLLDENKYIINIEENTDEDKVKILLNHLLFYDFDLSYFLSAQYDDYFEYIIKHRNYSPRHLDFFTRSYLKEDYQSSYSFYKSLNKYLDNPSTFWNEAFQMLNPTAKTILLVLLTSGDPISIDDLKSSFDNIQIKVREILNESIIPTDFYNELKKLEEFYISIDKNEYYLDTLIEFQSPGIKDYLLEFLRNDGYLWIQPIILKAKFFNQLTFIFSTKEEKVSDYESDTPLYGKKILLSKDLQSLLKQKLLHEFENLIFCNQEAKELSDQLTKYHSNEETKYFKLIELNRLFPINREKNNDVKKFILEKVLDDINSFENNRKVVAHRSMIYFPSVIKLLLPYLENTPNEIINIYYNSITFAAEYKYFYGFKDIFPQEFQEFYDSNIKKIRQHIKELIFDDIDYYLYKEEGLIGVELDSLLNWGIEELKKQYNFNITDKFINDLETTFDIDFSSLRETKITQEKVKQDSSKFEKEYKPKPYLSAIKEYLPAEDEEYSPLLFLRTHNYVDLLKIIKDNKSALYNLTSSKEIFEGVCHFIIKNEVDIDDLDTFQLLDKFFNHHCNQIDIQRDSFIEIGIKIIAELEQSGNYSITKSAIVQILEETKLPNIHIEDFKPIVISYGNWYRFGDANIETYIKAKYIASLKDSKFSELITQSLCDPDETKLLDFLQSANKEKLWSVYIIPELKKLIKDIDLTNERTILLSLVDFFNIEFDLSWHKNRKTLESYSSSLSNSYYEHILLFCNKKFYVSDFETYFEKDFQDSETILRLSLDITILNELYKRVISTISKKEVRSIIGEKPITIFEIKLSDFLKSDKNYKTLKDIGMVKYTFDLVQTIRGIIENLEVRTVNNV